MLENPVFAAYATAASIMIIKMAGQAWITVGRMIKVNAGLLNPEDLKPGATNPNPDPSQLEPNDYVERSRRMHRNDCENVPIFLVAGLLFAFTQPPLWLAQVLFYGYVATRLLHFYAYLTARSHELRAAFWTPGSLIIIGMAGYTLVYTVG